jgi:cephalosporin-C deacetylase-like acetyl esterase
MLKAMTRRQLLLALATPPIHYREYSRCLPDYLSGLAADAYARRNARIAKLTTPAAIREHQAWARSTFMKLIGGVPERTPLNTRTIGTFERSGYRVEKLVYEGRPGLFVTANLYLPSSGAPQYPAVLFQMGHSANGKCYVPYQRCCQGLARLGYIVLAFDPMGQGERVYYPRPGETATRLRSSDEEHTLPGRQMLLVGDTSSNMQLWDAVRSLDVLASHPQVDAKRIASTGQSGGGTITMLLCAVDERVACAAVCSGNTENFATQPFFPPGSTDDAEQDFVGSGRVAFDRWDLLWPMAPKPLLVGTSAHDFFGTYSPSYESSGREEFAKLGRAYAALGSAGALESFETPLPHGLSYSMRLSVYNFFERHLKGSRREIAEEPPTSPEPDETLWCGKSGNAVRDFGSRTPFAMLSEKARGIATPEVGPADLRDLLGVGPMATGAKLEVLATTKYANCQVQAVEVNTASKVWCPAWVFLPKGSWTKLLLVLEPNGRNGHWREDDLYPQLAESGMAVCAADVRGVGDLQPRFGSGGSVNYAREHQSEENYAWSSLILGRSLLGQRITDILWLTKSLAQAYPAASIIIAARDKMTVPALCAAAIETRISKVYLAWHLASWRSLTESETYSQTLANFAPGILQTTDLPQIARSIAPRAVIVAGATDAAGRILRQAPYVDYRAESPWDISTLQSL